MNRYTVHGEVSGYETQAKGRIDRMERLALNIPARWKGKGI